MCNTDNSPSPVIDADLGLNLNNRIAATLPLSNGKWAYLFSGTIENRFGGKSMQNISRKSKQFGEPAWDSLT